MTGTRSRAMPRRRGAVTSAVRPVAQRVANERRLVLWDVGFTREAGVELLRVSVDRTGGVDADEIAKFSEALSRELDAQDVVRGEARYVLEVSTPGAERKLRTPEEFAVCVGRRARVTFKSGRQPVEGVIGSAGEDRVRVGDEEVGYAEISQARLTVSE